MAQYVAEAGLAIKYAGAPGEQLSPFDWVCACLSPGVESVPEPVGLDPAAVLAVARRHQVSGLIATRLQAQGLAVPDGFERQARLGRQIALRQFAAARDLTDRFAAAGVEAVFLKGLALSQQAHGSPLVRYAADIDLLVDQAQVEAAGRLLDSAGYARVMPHATLHGARLRLYCRAAKDSVHRHPESGVTVELHWRMADELRDPGLPPAAARDRVDLGEGCGLAVLGAEQQFLYLCAHGAVHGWARLKWLADVAALLERAPDRGARWWDHARRHGGAVAAASAIVLAGELLGLAPPPGFVLPRSLRLTLLLRLSRAILQAGGGAQELERSARRGWSEMFAKLLVAPGWHQRAAVLRRLLMSGEDIATVNLPPLLFPLYPLLRLPLLVRRRMARRAVAQGRVSR